MVIRIIVNSASSVTGEYYTWSDLFFSRHVESA